MKKLIIFIMLITFGQVFSQILKGATVQENNNWTFGGGIGIGFGSNRAFNLSASPRVGYRFANDLEGGVIGSISWQSSDYYNSTMLGVGPFVNYYFARTFYMGANYQRYFIDYKNKKKDYKYNTEENVLYLGGGYMQRIGNNSYMQLGIMYNILWKQDSSVFSSGLTPNIGFVLGL